MKINRKPLRAESPRDLTEEEKAERVGQAMREARAYAEDQERRAKSKEYYDLILQAREERPPELRHASSFEGVIDNPSGKPTVIMEVIGKSNAEIARLMGEEPTVFTGLQWNGLDARERIETLRAIGGDTSRVTAESVLEVMPDATRDFLLAWQKQINGPDTWTSQDDVGQTAMELVEKGFCMLPRARIITPWNNIRGRTDVPPGSPGTPAFVKAVMGEAYLVWLTQQE